MSDPTRYRGFVGPREVYDLKGAQQFSMLTLLGLREHHYLLDIGCGSLRAGRLFIPYLLPGRYCGIEPNAWLPLQGIEKELGQDIVRVKRPTFSSDGRFALTTFGRTFDFLLAHAVFIHACAADIERCLAEAVRVMHERSLFLCDFTIADTDSQDTQTIYTGVDNTNTHFTTKWISAAARCVGLRPYVPSVLPVLSGRTWVLLSRTDLSSRFLRRAIAAAELTDCDTLRKETSHAG